MTLKKITGKDIKEAVDWLWEHKQDGGCIHQVLGTTDDGTKLCFVVGWAEGRDYGDDDKKYGYFDEGYCISAKIGYQHRNNAMQTDYDWDFNMPYDLETGDVWDTSSYVPRDADWEREAADYNKEASAIWRKYGKPNRDGMTALDLMESKKKEAKKHTCSMQKKKESLAKKNESSFDVLRVSDEDIAIVIHDIERFDDRFDDSMIPRDGAEYTLPEFRQLIGDLAETSNGFASVSRDGANILVDIEVPQENGEGELTDQYKEELVLCGTARIHDNSLDRVADYLNDYPDHR